MHLRLATCMFGVGAASEGLTLTSKRASPARSICIIIVVIINMALTSLSTACQRDLAVLHTAERARGRPVQVCWIRLACKREDVRWRTS